jgi:hypothetical protein
MSLLIETNRTKDRLIISFGGYDQRWGQIRRFEFMQFLTRHFPDIDRHFHMDTFNSCYHKGIDGHSGSIEETVTYLERLIRGYRHVYCIGVSSGGYAAILFGSLLKITGVLAFIPPTRLYGKGITHCDLNLYIHKDTQYLLVGDLSETQSYHHIDHCRHLAHHPNVEIVSEVKVNLPEMRDDGRLLSYLSRLISEK